MDTDKQTLCNAEISALAQQYGLVRIVHACNLVAADAAANSTTDILRPMYERMSQGLAIADVTYADERLILRDRES